MHNLAHELSWQESLQAHQQAFLSLFFHDGCVFFPLSLPDVFIIRYQFLKYLQRIRGYHGGLRLPRQARAVLALAMLHAEHSLFDRFLLEEF